MLQCDQFKATPGSLHHTSLDEQRLLDIKVPTWYCMSQSDSLFGNPYLTLEVFINLLAYNLT